MNELTAVFAVLGETYFKLRMTQDRLETVEQEASELKQKIAAAGKERADDETDN